MKKLIAVVLSLFLCTAIGFTVTACGGPSKEEPPVTEPETPDPENPGTQLQEITGVTFENASFVYDGEEKSITVTGEIPQGVTVEYKGNTGIDAGTYAAEAVLSGKNYKTLTLNAALTIEKAEITGVTFENVSAEYDGLEHSICVSGNVPQGVTVKYTYNGESVNGVTAVGKHTVRAVLTGKNYKELVMEATLTITSEEEMLYSVEFGGNLYFQNALDGNKLYSYGADGLKKVNNDVPNYFAKDGKNLYYYSVGVISSSIKQMVSAGKPSVLYSVKADYLTADGSSLFYAVNNLVNVGDKNGIYRLPLGADTQQTPVLVTSDKAEFLTVVGDTLYYSNKSDKGRLYKVSAYGENVKGTAVTENKVTELIADGNWLYYTDHTLTGSAIYKYDVKAGTSAKLSGDNGAYLTKAGNYLYYVNKDLLTSNIFGSGIYRINVLDGGIKGEKVLEAAEGDGYFALTSDGTDLYYYKLRDRHFYKYAVASEKESDLMKGFTPSQEETIAGYSRIAERGGEIYFTSLTDGNALYKYNIATKAKYKLVADSVSNVFFEGGFMYYSTYVLTNYALWRYDLKTSQTQKISSDRFEELVFDGETIYALRIVPAGNMLIKMNADGTGYTELYKKTGLHMTALEKAGDKLYCCSNPAFGYKKMFVFDLKTNTMQETEFNAENLVRMNGNIYYYDQKTKEICVLDGQGVSKKVLAAQNVRELYAFGGKLYFTGEYANAAGLFVYDETDKSCKKLTQGYTAGLAEKDGILYYVKADITYAKDYPVTKSEDGGWLYAYDLSSGTETKITRS